MNAKNSAWFALIVALTPFLSGCLCSHAVVEKMRSGNIDAFNPSTVYSQSSNGFALEGTRRNHFYRVEGGFGAVVGENSNTVPFHAFLIIPKDSQAFAPLQANASLSLEEIKKLPIGAASRLMTKRRLPSGYEKVADLPKNDVNIEIKRHHPAGALFLILPFTVIVDLVGFPYEYVWQMNHSEGW